MAITETFETLRLLHIYISNGRSSQYSGGHLPWKHISPSASLSIFHSWMPPWKVNRLETSCIPRHNMNLFSTVRLPVHCVCLRKIISARQKWGGIFFYFAFQGKMSIIKSKSSICANASGQIFSQLDNYSQHLLLYSWKRKNKNIFSHLILISGRNHFRSVCPCLFSAMM